MLKSHLIVENDLFGKIYFLFWTFDILCYTSTFLMADYQLSIIVVYCKRKMQITAIKIT